MGLAAFPAMQKMRQWPACARGGVRHAARAMLMRMHTHMHTCTDARMHGCTDACTYLAWYGTSSSRMSAGRRQPNGIATSHVAALAVGLDASAAGLASSPSGGVQCTKGVICTHAGGCPHTRHPSTLSHTYMHACGDSAAARPPPCMHACRAMLPAPRPLPRPLQPYGCSAIHSALLGS